MIRHVGSAYITPGHSCVKELHSRRTNSTATVNERRGGGNRMGTRDARPVAQYRALTSAIGDTHDDEGRVRLIHRTEAPHSLASLISRTRRPSTSANSQLASLGPGRCRSRRRRRRCTDRSLRCSALSTSARTGTTSTRRGSERRATISPMAKLVR